MRAAVVVLALVSAIGVASEARAQPLDAEQRAMTSDMEDYFRGEKNEGYVFLGVGLAALGTGAFLFTREDETAKGASYPVAIIGVIQTAAGAVLLVRTDRQVEERRDRIRTDPAGFKRDETDRMEKVARQFDWLEYGEIALLAGGVGLAVYGTIERKKTVQGVGIGLAAQSAIMLALDLFAAARADRYLDDLARFDPSASSSVSPLVPVRPMLGYRGSF